MNYKKIVRNVGRKIYKATGYQNPMKKGKIQASRVAKQIPKLARDVVMLKDMVNAEKEVYTAYNVTNQAVSPTSSVITPITNIAEGTTHGTRDGESVKLHGFRLNTRWQQQSNAVGPQFFKMWLVKYIGPRGATPSVDTFLKPDFDGNYSPSSERNEDWYTSYQVITAVSGRLSPDSLTGQTIYTLKKNYGRFRGKTHQRYSGAGATTLLTDQMYIIAVASNGAIGSTSAAAYDAQLLISFYDN